MGFWTHHQWDERQPQKFVLFPDPTLQIMLQEASLYQHHAQQQPRLPTQTWRPIRLTTTAAKPLYHPLVGRRPFYKYWDCCRKIHNAHTTWLRDMPRPWSRSTAGTLGTINCSGKQVLAWTWIGTSIWGHSKCRRSHLWTFRCEHMLCREGKVKKLHNEITRWGWGPTGCR